MDDSGEEEQPAVAMSDDAQKVDACLTSSFDVSRSVTGEFSTVGSRGDS
jgi:hypothetical protein